MFFLHVAFRIRPDAKEKNCIINICVFCLKKGTNLSRLLKYFQSSTPRFNLTQKKIKDKTKE
jgi:hypothetical protein